MRVVTRLILSLIFMCILITVVIFPVFANENWAGEQRAGKDDDVYYSDEMYSNFVQEGYDEKHRCSLPVPESFSTLVNLTIDKTLISATPHWVLLAAGKTEQKVLLEIYQ